MSLEIVVSDACTRWEALSASARVVARSVARQFRWDPHVADELAQEALMSLWCRSQRAGCLPDNERAWLFRTVRNIAARHCIRTRSPVGPLRVGRLTQGDMSRLSAWPASAPAKQNEEKEEARKALGLLGRLPPPYREIAALQYVHAWKRTAVTTVIRRWRPVGEEEARRLIRITHAMLRALGREDDIRRSWPEAFRTTRNPWLTTPLPRRWPLLGGPIRI